MTLRQKFLKAVYPVMMWFTKQSNTNTITLANPAAEPLVPLYTLSATLTNGSQLDLNSYRGKKILLVNTASDCGYTPQFDGLEKLYQQFKDRLVILAFPANDFREQENGADENIAAFCKINFGVTFPLMKKSKVIKGAGQNEIFAWLTNKDKNGWNDQVPTWNFCKYMVNENGWLTHFFASSVDPLSSEVMSAVKQ
ncbi:MAG: glutathione peroxidase [Aquabacterium sp.]|nr:glutathione peroxidase [Ferruginibacter sp.]